MPSASCSTCRITPQPQHESAFRLPRIDAHEHAARLAVRVARQHRQRPAGACGSSQRSAVAGDHGAARCQPARARCRSSVRRRAHCSGRYSSRSPPISVHRHALPPAAQPLVDGHRDHVADMRARRAVELLAAGTVHTPAVSRAPPSPRRACPLGCSHVCACASMHRRRPATRTRLFPETSRPAGPTATCRPHTAARSRRARSTTPPPSRPESATARAAAREHPAEAAARENRERRFGIGQRHVRRTGRQARGRRAGMPAPNTA